ncbi:MAG: hypothetical protein ACI9KE_004055 [Polyangiales bacterium]|jgi:hypothetical protein
MMAGCASEARMAAPMLITPEAGGTITLGANEVVIPPMALATATEVVLLTSPLSSLEPLENGVGEALIMEPEGTILELAATVTLPVNPSLLVEGATVSVKQLISGDGVMIWTDIASELNASAGEVMVSVTRFAPLAVVVETSVVGGGNVIEGTIRWGDESPAGMTPVELFESGGASPLTSTMTAADGTFTFADLSAGDYTIVVDFECLIEETVTVSADAPTSVSLTLCGS